MKNNLKKNLYQRVLHSFAFFIIMLNTSFANNSKIERAGRAYGFILGQETSLTMIKRQFPNLENEANNAYVLFDKSFGVSKLKIQDYLFNSLGNEGFEEFELTLKKEIEDALKNVQLGEDESKLFIMQIKERAIGKISTPVLETLLAFKYSENPVEEMKDGFTETYSTIGKPKAKKTVWSIKVPKSWKSEEAEGENIVQKFRSDYGDGEFTLMMMVLKTNEKGTTKDLLLSESDVKKQIPAGSELLNFQKMYFDKRLGCMFEVEHNASKAVDGIKFRQIQFVFQIGENLCMLQFFISGKSNEEDLTIQKAQIIPLYQAIANSVIIKN